MNDFIYLLIYLIIMALISAYIYSNKKQVDKIMKREDNTYTGIFHNSFDIYRIHKVLKKSISLSYEESIVLKNQFRLALVNYFLLIAYFITIIFIDW